MGAKKIAPNLLTFFFCKNSWAAAPICPCRGSRSASDRCASARYALYFLQQLPISPIRGLDLLVREIDQHLLDLPHVLRRQTPVVAGAASSLRSASAETLQAAGVIDVAVVVTPRQRARRAEARLAAVQAGVARAGDRAPARVVAIDEDHVVEPVLRLEAHHERRIAVLLHHHRRKQRRLEAMRRLEARHRAETAQGLAAGFGVVGQRVQPALHLRRRVEPRDERALGAGEGQRGRLPTANGRSAQPAARGRDPQRSTRCCRGWP